MKTVLGIITDNNKILIGKLKKEQLEAFGGIEYVFPGGKIEDGETSTNAVIREIKEETGLDTVIVEKIGERVHPKTLKEIEYFHCKRISGVETTASSENNDIDTLVWVDIKELPTYMPTLFPKVKEYLEGLIPSEDRIIKV